MTRDGGGGDKTGTQDGKIIRQTDRQTDRGQPRPHFPSTPCEPARPTSPHRDPGCRYSLLVTGKAYTIWTQLSCL
ncbi:hypothetical protein M433DRAFT_10192 [Acidomyces richmondensis BFW]|nr:hypothetical protein M433DRAFT_10192 [Acidomyces richmondensis BFW]